MATRDDLLNKLGRGQAPRRVAVGEQLQPVATQPTTPTPQVGASQAEARVGVQPTQPTQQVAQPAQVPQPIPQQGVDQASARAGVQPTGSVAPTPVPTPSATPVTPVAPRATSAAPQPKVTKSYTELIESLSKRKGEYQPLSPEDIEAERKRRKREALFSALGDGLSSLANLYFTSKGAENMFDPNNALTRVAQKRWAEDKKEQQAKDDRYLQLQKVLADLEMGRLDKEKADAIREQERADRKADAAQRQANWNAEMQYRREKDAADAKARKEQQQFQSEEAAKGRAYDAEKQRRAFEFQKGENVKERASRLKNTLISRAGGKGGSLFTEDEVAYLYGKIPDDFKTKVGDPVKDITGKTIDHRNPTKSQMESLIIEYASTDEKYWDMLHKATGVSNVPSSDTSGKPGWSPDKRAKHQAPISSE